jgi:uncharacterized protein YegP (UPF0339 family)
MRFVVFRNLVGQWQWKLVSPNRRIIAESVERYWKKADCEAGIELVKSSAQAPVEEA